MQKKMAAAYATALAFNPIKLLPKKAPYGLLSDLGYLLFITILINSH